jgi:hypothetical protein
MIGALVAQSLEQAPFTSAIVDSILATDLWHCFLPQGMLTGWVGIIPLLYLTLPP